MFKYGGIILGIFALFGTFFVAQKAKAADTPQVIVNEVLANAPNDDTNHEITDLEWFELYNPSVNPINLNNSKIEIYNSVGTKTKTIEISNDLFLFSKDYLLFVKDWSLVKSFWNLEDSINHYVASFSLVNSGGKIKLILPESIHEFIWAKDVGDSISMEIIGPPYDDSYSQRLPCATPTPGTQNMANKIKPPKKPNLTLPENKANFIAGDEIKFDWDKENDVDYALWLSEYPNMSAPFGLDDIESLKPGTYYWQVVASNVLYPEVKSDIYSFSISEPIYSNKNIIINEICPHPQDGVDYEFIELFNSGNEEIDLGGWFLDDADGGSSPYKIPAGTIIGPKEYLTFFRSVTNIALNDSGGDSARLLFPNSEIASSIAYSEYATLGYSYSRKPDSSWAWTTTPTFGSENIFTSPPSENKGDIEEPINTVPIEIATGSFQDYLNKLVKVTGKVTSTSGNTFYLDDGSGEVKIYIQEKTGIQKPEMHKNDIFEVIGIVDLYGQTWRILPQKQEDIKLIETAPIVVKSLTAKSTAKKSSSSTAVKSIGTAASIGPKKVEAANNSPPSENSAAKTPFWIQLIKTLLGLAVILLVILIIRLRQRPKEKIIGGHFGDET